MLHLAYQLHLCAPDCTQCAAKGKKMQEQLTLPIDKDTNQAGKTLTEFQDEELRQLEAKGISLHHLALFLESLRANLDPDSVRRSAIPVEEG